MLESNKMTCGIPTVHSFQILRPLSPGRSIKATSRWAVTGWGRALLIALTSHPMHLATYPADYLHLGPSSFLCLLMLAPRPVLERVVPPFPKILSHL